MKLNRLSDYFIAIKLFFFADTHTVFFSFLFYIGFL